MISLIIALIGIIILKIGGIGVIAFCFFSNPKNYSNEDLFLPTYQLFWKKTKVETILICFGMLLILVAVLLYIFFHV
jgi:hypothetical protein